MAFCMVCHNHHELMELRSFRNSVENGEKWKRFQETIEKQGKRLDDATQKARYWKEKKGEAERGEKEARSELRSVIRDRDRLQKELDTLKPSYEERTQKAVDQALKAERAKHAEATHELIRLHNEEKKAAAEAVRSEMQNTIDSLTAQLSESRKMIQKLETALHELPPSRPVANGANSGTPTSQTPIGQRKIIPGTQRGQGKHIGGQPGHKPHFAAQFDENDPDLKTVKHELENRVCPCCGKPVNTKRWIPRDTAEIEINVIKRRDLYEEAECADCGRTYKVPIPVEQSGTLCYGSSLQALSVWLMTLGNVPMQKTADFIREATNGTLTPTAGYTAKLMKKAADGLGEFTNDLKNLALAQPILYWDDTVSMVHTHRSCIRFYGTEAFSLYRAHWTKSRATVDKDGILGLLDESTAVMHDHCSINYNEDFLFMNLDCAIHLVRAIESIREKSSHRWAADMLNHIRKAIHDRKVLISKGESGFSAEYLETFWNTYREILDRGCEECAADRNRYYHDDEETLLVRIRNYTPNYFAWVTCFDFPITDNLSELGLRGVKSKQKIAGQFQTIDAMEDYAAVLSYIGTCRKCNADVMTGLTRLMEGNPFRLEEILPQDELNRLSCYQQKLSDSASSAQAIPSTSPDQKDSSDSVVPPESSAESSVQESLNSRIDETAPQRWFHKILEFMSAPHTSEEMRPILTERGDARRMFRKEARKWKKGKRGREKDDDIIDGEDKHFDGAEGLSGGEKSKKKNDRKSGKKPDPSESGPPDLVRRKKKRPAGRPRKDRSGSEKVTQNARTPDADSMTA